MTNLRALLTIVTPVLCFRLLLAISAMSSGKSIFILLDWIAPKVAHKISEKKN